MAMGHHMHSQPSSSDEGVPERGGGPNASDPGSQRCSGEVDLGPLPRRLGRYEILERVGAGGMGTVFRARQIPMDRIVALKVIASSLAKDKRYLRRFVREARAAGALDHPNIVEVHDVGNAEGYPYICMEFVDGSSVEQFLRHRGRLSPTEAVEVAIRVAEALEHAHEAGIVHCDIKPDNILIDKRGMAKLADLGLARRHSGVSAESGTFHGIGMGTPHYVSLEQARDIRNADARSDIYSLGATLYHMITGRVPFDGNSTVDIIMRVAQEDCPDPASLAPGVPPTLTAITRRMLARSPADRYQNASSLLHDLRAVRSELAGLGPADLLDHVSAPAPARSPGGVLYVLAASIAAVSLAAAIAASMRPQIVPPRPEPAFVRADEPSRPEQAATEMPPPPPGDGREAIAAPPVDTTAGVRTRVESTTPPPSGTAAAQSRDEAVHESRWQHRAGRFGAAEATLTRFAASVAGAAQTEALSEIEKLHERAEAEATRVLRMADEVLAAGRVEEAVRLLTWALECWGMPLLEARAEDALRSAREASERIHQRRRERARAETDARQLSQRAEEHAAERRFGAAADVVGKAVARLDTTGSPDEARCRRRQSVLWVLEQTHERLVARLAGGRHKVQAGDVLNDWPSPDATIDDANAERLYVTLSRAGARAARRWADLQKDEYARLAERCSRADRRDEMLGAGLAWLEAGRPDEALRVWQSSTGSPAGTDLIGGGDGKATAVQLLERARACDASGRERAALETLEELLSTAAAADEVPAEVIAFAQSLRQAVALGAGLAGTVRAGPGEAVEFVYDFSQPEVRNDWNSSGNRLRQSGRAVTSPSGGRSALEFGGPFVAGWECVVSVRLMEGADCFVEFVVLPEQNDTQPNALLRVDADALAAREAPAEQPPLARDVHDVIVFRRWDELRWGAGRGTAAIPLDRRLSVKQPAGPERLVIRLGGWVELQRVRLRGVVDPAWFAERRAKQPGPVTVNGD
jgi:tetratricopeptide (TPR) repeat protein